MQNVVMVSVYKLSVVMLSVCKWNVVILNVGMQNVVKLIVCKQSVLIMYISWFFSVDYCIYFLMPTSLEQVPFLVSSLKLSVIATQALEQYKPVFPC